MKLTITNFYKHKTYVFSFVALLSLGVFCSVPAYSQIDYNYGISQKGFRLGVGVGAGKLQTYWGSTPLSPVGLISLDYNVSRYFSLGVEGQFGQLVGEDNQQHYAWLKSSNTFYGGNVNMKFGVGLISDFSSGSGFTDALKRFYLGVGFGSITSNVTLSPRYDNLIVSPGQTLPTNTTYGTVRSMSFYMIPISIGTNIDLRGFWGNDKVELTPMFQYNMGVNIGKGNYPASFFDGYQPNSETGNGAYAVVSLSLKYKF